MLVKARLVANDDDGVAIKIAVEHFLFDAWNRNQRAGREHLRRLQDADALERGVGLDPVLFLQPVRMALYVLGRHHDPALGEVRRPHFVGHNDQDAFG
ncbi:hypothetical protein, partial [Mesorhizobium sp.]|uniref:hypothetical protein n=1 Tax=Mesorhizobium sp. TaxID=1871066 RepID=UPI0025BD3590